MRRSNDQTAASLADILIHVGAVRAIELDINAEWPSLITYGHGGVGYATKVVPNTQQSTIATSYPTTATSSRSTGKRRPAALRVPFG